MKKKINKDEDKEVRKGKRSENGKKNERSAEKNKN